ncbi:hypothetical protein IGI04_022362 [Brassica rapa subsp. trilocularis]|uniref:Uncharacterized protein n=1 Tax=Brassica rapa subsp. trilocularis TaxID=1813537 RepID=A0ABQ7M456_BRACM|nr:hypothetical protein IGI04_022362 [Brassica rapa subsp. trilocularis]
MSSETCNASRSAYYEVILEWSSIEAWKALTSPACFPNVSYGLSRLLRKANEFEQFQVLLTPPGINSIALSIALGTAAAVCPSPPAQASCSFKGALFSFLLRHLLMSVFAFS